LARVSFEDARRIRPFSCSGEKIRSDGRKFRCSFRSAFFDGMLDFTRVSAEKHRRSDLGGMNLLLIPLF
jgi:hypothetical protein